MRKVRGPRTEEAVMSVEWTRVIVQVTSKGCKRGEVETKTHAMKRERVSHVPKGNRSSTL